MSNQPKTFTVWSDELEGILSPLFFTSKPLNKKGFIELKEIAFINPTRKKPKFENEELVPYVGLPEAEDGEIKEVWMRPFKEVKGRNVIRKGDILFARIEPSVFNKKYIFVEDLKGNEFAFTSTEFYIVEPKDNVNPLFLFHMLFLQPVYDQVIGKTTGSTGRRRLDKGVFEKILIPFPSREVQDRIVDRLVRTYSEKKRKEEEIKELLASVDGYVLGELGIDLPGEKVAGGGQLHWIIWSDELTDGRIDPIYLRDFALFKKIKSTYPFVSLGDLLAEPPQYGANERAVDGIPSKDIRYIRITDINDEGKLRDGDWKTAGRIDERYFLNEGDILFARSGSTVGKAFIYENAQEKAIFAGYMIRFKFDKSRVDPEYVFYLTQTSYYRLWKNLIQRPTGQPNINSEEFKSLKIPLPPLSEQQKIVKKAKALTTKAASMRVEIREMLNEIESEINRTILA